MHATGFRPTLGCGMGVIVIWECDSGRLRPRAKVRAGSEGTEGTDIGVCSGAAVVANSVVCFEKLGSSEAAVVEAACPIIEPPAPRERVADAHALFHGFPAFPMALIKVASNTDIQA
eukprot:scaffold110399_cov51-Phaeocystis_antarctica.AAC.2